MKKLLSQIMVLSLVVVLAKLGGPGVIDAYYGVNGTNVANVAEAKQFNSIKEAYALQLELGTDWSIVTE